MNIMLTVSYAIDIPRDAFFHAKSGVVNEEIMRRLETLFPKRNRADRECRRPQDARNSLSFARK